MNLLFTRTFFRHPRMLGSIIPSSRFLVRNLLETVDWANAQVIVEYGPGLGTVTQEILARMRPDAKLIAIELNSEFVQHLRTNISDKRLQVVEGSAESVAAVLSAQNAQASYIVSGIPFSTLPPRIRKHILLESRRVLEPGGRFVLYQFSRQLLPELRSVFRHVQTRFEPLNLLPAHVFFCSG